ncbi:L,D-transpeptidase-like protein [Flavobacterium cutihirudinis]|uniref:L,D-transpeptidase-like protein n=1 Tax=Flavobacterium cutihirudinis TaxID=1265740 RepID=A0A3D9FSR7_9FLAO|nr:murein L,D-transpeptidase catalytic domain family protein [Flavobacterium cutihirudinis]RED23687.1 L,D-transpeptidase-like protein [Flavobacterium cutihirudinis]
MKFFNLIVFLTVSFIGVPKALSGKENWTTSDVERFNSKLSEVKEMMKTSNSYNNKIAFFIDMKIKSGKNRFFVYDLENDKILDEGLVAHGCGSETGIAGDLKFSNEPNSNATSLGRYSIRKSYNGIFGKAYKLAGLDQTNSNAFKRAVVLHSYSAVPEQEQDYYISRSHGCPMVNEAFFKRLEKIIDASKTSIILNIYY